MNNISCVIIAKNAAGSLPKTLDSLADFSEVVVYDNGSTDATKEIARQYANVKLVCGEFYGFGETKNHAASFASHDWILSLDADEVVTPELLGAIASAELQPEKVYRLVRVNYYRDHEIRYCWKQEHLTRLYHRGETNFNDYKVHEFVLDDGFDVVVLDGILKHYPYANLSDFLQKADRYSTLFAQERCGKKQSSPVKAVISAWFSFLKKYLFKLGFLDGYPGLVISVSHMVTNFYKYLKLYEANKDRADLRKPEV